MSSATQHYETPVIDVFGRWAALYEKGMYQLARLEMRTVAERDRYNAEASFALAQTELAMGNPMKALRAFQRARNALLTYPPERAAFQSMKDVLDRVLAQPDLRKLPAPLDPYWWLEDPRRVGTEQPERPGAGRFLLRMKPLVFRSPLDAGDFADFERRASTFSYDLFQLGETPHVSRGMTERQRQASSSRNKRLKAEEVRERGRAPKPISGRDEPKSAAPAPAPAWQQQFVPPKRTAEPEQPAPAPVVQGWPPPTPQAGGSWPPQPSAPPVRPAPPPAVKARVGRDDAASIRMPFERPKFDATAGKDPWLEWEVALYDLVDSGELTQALDRVRQALHRHPDSSRIREHEARVLARIGNWEESAAAWLETYRRAVSANADERAERAARELLAINWRDTADLTAVASALFHQGSSRVAIRVLRAAAERLEAAGRLDGVFQIVRLLGQASRADSSGESTAMEFFQSLRAKGFDTSIIENAYREGRSGK